MRQTRGMKRAGETRASFKRPLQRSLLRAFYEESGPINQRPPSDNWIHSLEIVRTFLRDRFLASKPFRYSYTDLRLNQIID